jgi:hypothetical protein
VSDPFPAVAEAEATGETAALFADIRATVGVPVVNLVWRTSPRWTARCPGHGVR